MTSPFGAFIISNILVFMELNRKIGLVVGWIQNTPLTSATMRLLIEGKTSHVTSPQSCGVVSTDTINKAPRQCAEVLMLICECLIFPFLLSLSGLPQRKQ